MHKNDAPDFTAMVAAACRVRDTFAEQASIWKQRSFIERQWILRDFKKRAGLPVEQWQARLDRIEAMAKAGDTEGLSRVDPPISVLGDYYRHMAELAKTYTRDEALLASQLETIETWIQEADSLNELLAATCHGKSHQ